MTTARMFLDEIERVVHTDERFCTSSENTSATVEECEGILVRQKAIMCSLSAWLKIDLSEADLPRFQDLYERASELVDTMLLSTIHREKLLRILHDV